MRVCVQVCAADVAATAVHAALAQLGVRATHQSSVRARRWAYVHLIAYLHVRERTDLTGTESYVVGLIAEGDTSWFPQHRAMCLRSDAADDSDGAGATRGDMRDARGALAGAAEAADKRAGEAVRALGELAEGLDARLTASAERIAQLARRGEGPGGGGGGE